MPPTPSNRTFLEMISPVSGLPAATSLKHCLGISSICRSCCRSQDETIRYKLRKKLNFQLTLVNFLRVGQPGALTYSRNCKTEWNQLASRWLGLSSWIYPILFVSLRNPGNPAKERHARKVIRHTISFSLPHTPKNTVHSWITRKSIDRSKEIAIKKITESIIFRFLVKTMPSHPISLVTPFIFQLSSRLFFIGYNLYW